MFSSQKILLWAEYLFITNLLVQICSLGQRDCLSSLMSTNMIEKNKQFLQLVPFSQHEGQCYAQALTDTFISEQRSMLL